MLETLKLLVAALKAKDYATVLRKVAILSSLAADLYSQLIGGQITTQTMLDATDAAEIDLMASELVAIRDEQSATDGAAVAALDPGSWLAIINAVLAIIEIIRKRRAQS